ncbi:hypothetical protein NEUTE1DRAFT_137160 [Neurospora tetrasperma FGSC 2508]|uniref:Uncharacterized protein n=1 Tax=Neurospora tetrasperma (strain FGSC 2508 / ATCC MYA-4615 / P0657) TaxID=510951 RepID=F8MJX9_NEUT8|nr:uncharacterized protein NEUTE1DRAFT_137160 [Neurospora tetrasperma FGSC 2508]EGO57316.1 hypothetical protein NEUTE1DRAFT_137160 [Neurospora tetrasperma FGSC 2508]EGZ72432.1 hypothetical protein NEUTE2DRAFT_167323 [Neurospora tetrasperma FGSC 2509]
MRFSWTCPLSASLAKSIYSLSTSSAGAARAAAVQGGGESRAPNNNNVRHKEVTARARSRIFPNNNGGPLAWCVNWK